MIEDRNDRHVRAADTTLLVLETVAFARDELGVTQIARELGLTKGAVYRHLQGLVEHGYLVQDPTSARYRLGPKAYLIGRRALPADDVATVAEGPLRELRDAFGLTAVLSAPTPRGPMVLTAIFGGHPFELLPGTELTFHASAQGKVMLAFSADSILEWTLQRHLPAMTPHTITDPAKVRIEVDRVRGQGYALAPEELRLGFNAVAAPVFNRRSHLVAAIGLVDSIQYMPREPGPGLIDAVIAMANKISRNLGSGDRARRGRPPRTAVAAALTDRTGPCGHDPV